MSAERTCSPSAATRSPAAIERSSPFRDTSFEREMSLLRNRSDPQVAEFHRAFAHGMTPKKKHLLHRVVKEAHV